MTRISKNLSILVVVLVSCCGLMFLFAGRYSSEGNFVLVDDVFHLNQQREEVRAKLKDLQYRPRLRGAVKGFQETYEFNHGERYLSFSYNKVDQIVAIGGDFHSLKVGEERFLRGTEGTLMRQALGPAQGEKRLSHERVIFFYERWGLALLFDRGKVKGFTLRERVSTNPTP